MDIIIFASRLHTLGSIMGRRKEALQAYFGTEEIHYHSFEEEFSPEGVTACFIATGGTEELFAKVWEKLPRPILLVSDGYHNSFAAAFEIASFLEQLGVPHKLVNLPLEDAQTAMAAPTATAATPLPSPYTESVLAELAAQRIGLIGGASSWLISSGIDREAVSARFGAKFVDIPICELEAEYQSTPAEEVVEEASTYSREALADAERMYRALKAICARYDLTALTIKCFDLLDSCRTTSCLALARLSDEGIISGCEGDIPSLWTLIVAKAMTGRPAFMANPSSSNPAECTVDFAHCTIPISMTESHTLPSHFESGIGIGIAGIIAPGPCKLLKIGGTSLDKVYHAEGCITINTRIPERCRTQVRFRFPDRAEFDRFINNRLGNHVILYR